MSWHPTSPYHVASVGYDGTLRVWDTRSKTHLFSHAMPMIEAEDGRGPKAETLLAVSWGDGVVAVGGNAKTLHVLEMPTSDLHMETNVVLR